MRLAKMGRSPCGERGLKCSGSATVTAATCRSPCGERGLKCQSARKLKAMTRVAPRAGSVD